MQSWQLLSASKIITIHNSQSQSLSPVAQYNPHRGIVNCAVYNHTGKVIASCGQDGKIALHSAQKYQQKLLQLIYHSGNEQPSSLNCCMFSPKSKFIAAGSVNSTVKIWDMKINKQKQPYRKLKGHSGSVTSIAWINNEQFIASASTSGDILLHEILTGSIKDSLTHSNRIRQGINNIKVSEGEGYKRLAACTNSGSVFIWDVNAQTKKPTYTYEDPKKSSFTCLSISSFRPVFMACSSIDSSIVFMDINQRKVIKTVGTEEPLTSIAFNDDGQILAAGGMNGNLMIYDLRKLQNPLFRLSGHDTPLKSICFSQKQKDKQKQRDKDKEKMKGRDKQSTNYSKSSHVNIENIQRSASDIPVDKQPRTKTLTPGISTNKLGNEQQRNRSRNLGKKQQATSIGGQQKIPPLSSQPESISTYGLSQAPQIPSYQYQPRNIQTTINTAGGATISRFSPQTTGSNFGPQSEGQLKSLQQRLISEMKNMEMRFNEKFQALHLQVIRQMQMSVEKMSQCFEKSHNYQRQLQAKIKQLEIENENLRKRTY